MRCLSRKVNIPWGETKTTVESLRVVQTSPEKRTRTKKLEETGMNKKETLHKRTTWKPPDYIVSPLNLTWDRGHLGKSGVALNQTCVKRTPSGETGA